MCRTHIGASVQFSSYGKMRKQIEMLEHHADVAAYRQDLFRIFGQFDAVDDDPSLLPVFEAIDATKQRRLAAAGSDRR